MSAQAVPPFTLPVLPDAIPEELRARAQWVTWRWELRGADWTKPPRNAHGNGYAKSTDPRTWTDFATALAYAQRNGIAGLGYVFAPDDPYCGIDLDGCRDRETGEIAPWALDIIRDLDSYAEVSPSGRGVKIVARGELPERGGKRGPIEMYREGRYFTVTGHRLPDAPPTINARPEQVAALYAVTFPAIESEPVIAPPVSASIRAIGMPSDDEVLRFAAAAKNGPRFTRLWSGDAGDDASGADLALCNELAFWVGPDSARIDALFRMSGLMRAKWDRRHRSDGATYGQMTIEKALEGRTDFWKPGTRYEEYRATKDDRPVHVATATDTASDEAATDVADEPVGWDAFLQRRISVWDAIENGIAPPEFLVEPIVLAGKVTSIFGGPEQGKTWVLLHSVLDVIRQGKKVMLLDEEAGIRDTAERLEAMGLTAEDDTRLFYFPFALEGTLEEMAAAIIEGVVRERIALIGCDSLSKLFAASGLDENSNSDATRLMRAWITPASHIHGCAVLALDHKTKVDDDSRYGRGAGSKLADVDVQWHIEATVPPSRTSKGRIVLTKKKDRTASVPGVVRLIAGGDGQGNVTVAVEGSTANQPARVIRNGKDYVVMLYGTHNAGLTFTEWMNALGAAKTTFRRTIDRLTETGAVELRDAHYFVTPTGVETYCPYIEKNSPQNEGATRSHFGATAPDGIGAIWGHTPKGVAPSGPSMAPTEPEEEDDDGKPLF